MSDERFGQCAPADATLRTRVEVAAALLCLTDPDALLSALFDAGLHVVTAPDKAVLAAMADTPDSALRRTIRLRSGQTQAAAAAELAARAVR